MHQFTSLPCLRSPFSRSGTRTRLIHTHVSFLGDLSTFPRWNDLKRTARTVLASTTIFHETIFDRHSNDRSTVMNFLIMQSIPDDLSISKASRPREECNTSHMVGWCLHKYHGCSKAPTAQEMSIHRVSHRTSIPDKLEDYYCYRVLCVILIVCTTTALGQRNQEERLEQKGWGTTSRLS